MKAHTIFLNISLAISAGCLGGAYMMHGYWMIIPALIFMMTLWITTRKKSEFWSASALLLIYVTLTAIGVMIDLSVPIMVLGCASSLVCWDLSHFRHNIVDIPSNESIVALERDRIQLLAVMVFASLLLTALSSTISLELPFVAIILLVLLGVGGLSYGLQFIRHNH